jgi:hypothetical protein
MIEHRPFRNFKDLIDTSDYRQDWIDFKKQANIDWVKEQIVMKAY